MRGTRSIAFYVGRWSRLGANPRLMIGAGLVLVTWFLGLSGGGLAQLPLIWPQALLIAAVGWSRVGPAMRPALVLVLLSLLYDMSNAAPFGSYMIVALSAYGFQAFAQSLLDLDTDPAMKLVVPMFSLAFGFSVLWLLATATIGQAIGLAPIMLSGLSTALVYLMVSPVFSLRVRTGGRSGRRG